MSPGWVTPEFLRALGRDLGWLPGRWNVLDGPLPLTPHEGRELLLRERRRLLVASEGGRAHLRVWLDSPRTPSPTSVQELRAAIDDRLLFYGDEDVLPVAVEGFARLPAPVRDVLLGEVAVFAVGSRTNAWTAPSRIEDHEGKSRSRVIVISGRDRTFDELLLTFLHECGHCWHVALAGPTDVNITTQGRAGLAKYIAVEAPAVAAAWVLREGRDERLADAMAHCWLTGPAGRRLA